MNNKYQIKKAPLMTLALCLSLNGCASLSGNTTLPATECEAISTQQMQGYLNGEGMGQAKLAEVNHYPGPQHVLDLAQQLELSPEQVKQTQSLIDEMHKYATQLGQQLVTKQRQLALAFTDGSIDDDSLAQLLADIGRLKTKIRYVHLRAHLKQQALLSEVQLQRYYQLRSASPPPHQHREQ